jgi:hypothetical protein
VPTTPGLFVTVKFLGRQPFANNLKFVPTDTGLDQFQSLQAVEMIQVDLVSRDSSALDRQVEVDFALHSQAALNLEAAEAMQIAVIASGVVDGSFLEETAELNRIVFTIKVIRQYTQTKPAEYFDTFENPEVAAEV